MHATSSAAPRPLSISLFGAFDVRIHDRPLPHLRSAKGKWLLALLALRAPRAVERSWLAGLLWQESGEAEGAYNLRRSLSDLRHALGGEAYRLSSPSAHTLALDICGVRVDVLDFDRCIEVGTEPIGRRCRPASAETTLAGSSLWPAEFLEPQRAAALERAITLYSGPLLEGCDLEWVAVERTVREHAWMVALERLAEHALACDQPAAAIAYLRRALATDPFRESAVRALLRALAAVGAYPEAAVAYRDYRCKLRRELNCEPDTETSALFRCIRRDQAHSLGALLQAVGSARG